MDEAGFLWIRHKSNVTLELDDAMNQVKEIAHICENKKTPFLIDVRVVNWDAPKEVRKFHATNKELLRTRKAEAILVNSMGLRMLANFYNKFNKPPNPVKVFTNEANAIRWTLEMRDR